MKANDVLSPDEIRELTRPSDWAGSRAIAVSWGIVCAVSFALARWPHPVTFVLAVVVLGGRQLALAVAMHEAAHGTLFRTRALNDTLGSWLCAWPVWADVARYRRHHLRHHAHVGTDRDPDASLVAPFPTTRRSLVRKLARDLLGLSGLKRMLGLVLVDAELLEYTVSTDTKRLPWKGVRHHAWALLRHASGPAVANVALVTLWVVTGHGWTAVAWGVAYLTTFGAYLRIRSMAEHACTEASPDPFLNTRTTRANVLERLLVAPLNVHHHVEHHLLMTVPYHRLPALHRVLVQRNAFPAGTIAPGYAAVLRTVSSRAS